MLDAKRASGLSLVRRSTSTATLRAALGGAERWGLVNRNANLLTEPDSIRRREVVPFTPEEVGRLLEASASDRLGPLFTLALPVEPATREALGLVLD